MDALVVSIVFIFGLLIGSFINVLSLRFGFSESTRHRSECQACTQQLSWYELLPLVSYVFLRGKCRTCKSAISIQYPLVEFTTGLLFVYTFMNVAPFQNLLHILLFVSLIAFWCSFLLILIYDIRHTLVPTLFVIPFFVFAVLIRILESFAFSSLIPLYDALWGTLALGGFMLFIVLITRGRGMGVGDIYIAGILGIFFGFARGVEVLVLSFWVGAVVGILLMLFSAFQNFILIRRLSSPNTPLKISSLRKGFKMKSEVPFVPFLFAAALLGAYTQISPFALVDISALLL